MVGMTPMRSGHRHPAPAPLEQGQAEALLDRLDLGIGRAGQSPNLSLSQI